MCESKESDPEVGERFVCGRCKRQAHGFMDSVEEFCEEVKTVRGFCYLGDRVNASGVCEATVNWLGEVQGIQGVAELKKVLAEDERNGLSELCKIGDVIWE